MQELTTEINSIKYFYHATPKSNLGKILTDGIIPHNGEIYLADSFQNAMKFLILRSSEPIIVFKIKASKLKRGEIKESFDHSYEFFKCKAYTYSGGIISTDNIDLNNVRVFGS
jgi:RNA:NAD 2'-phosphotransferase (TPT1/KptA family)